jgi:sterol desaturase/sphingolipid hydroxylase (fatty acid hydroxylase superfamily)
VDIEWLSVAPGARIYFGMGKIKHLAWALGIVFACGLLLLPGNGALQRFAIAHQGVAIYALVPLLVAIPASIVTFAAAFLLEWLFVGWSRSSLKSVTDAPASVRLDILSVVMNLVSHSWLGYVLSLGVLYVVDIHLLQPANVSLTHRLPSWGVQVAGVVLFQSLVSYWMHRLEHAIPALWALHKFHHSADRMSILTTDRQTALLKGVEQVLLLLVLGFAADPTAPKPNAGNPLFAFVVIYFAYRTFMGVNHYLCHSNLTTDYGWFGRWLLVSPKMHRLHHATLPQFHDKNFTFDLVLWDRLFGTYATCDTTVLSALPLGLEDNPFNSGSAVRCTVRDYFLTPYIVFWQALRKGLEAWLPRGGRGPGPGHMGGGADAGIVRHTP